MARQRPDPQIPPVRVAPLGELRAYTVYEHELEALGTRSAGALFLDFALVLLPVSVTLIVTLLTTTIGSDRLFLGFLSVAVIAAIAGLVLLLLWWQAHTRSRDLIAEIKARMPPPQGIPASPLPGVQTTTTAPPTLPPQ